MTKNDGAVEFERLETSVRSDLERKTRRAMAVLRPLKLVIENYPEDASETFEAPNHPADPALGAREVPFSRELFIERDDFMEDPPRKFFRFAPGREVRLRYACLVTCTGGRPGPPHRRDRRDTRPLRSRIPRRQGPRRPQGEGRRPLGMRPPGRPGHGAALRRLFRDPAPGRDVERLAEEINPDSLEVLESSVIEPSLGLASPGDHFQFERLGYFVADSRDHGPGAPVFNRTVTLRDTWSRQRRKGVDSGEGRGPATRRTDAMRRSRRAFARVRGGRAMRAAG